MTIRTARSNDLQTMAENACDITQRDGVLIIAIVAFCDSAAPLGYLFPNAILPIHAAGIVIKCFILLLLGRPGTLSKPVLQWLLLVTCLFVEGVFLDIVNFGTFQFESTRYIAVVAQIGLTLLIISADQFRTYARWVIAIPFLTFIIHVVLAHLGQIQVIYGRYLFVGNSHPNLGGEIGAVVVLAAALSLKVKYFLPIATIIGYSCILMQARAALLTICFLTIVRLWLGLPTVQRYISFAIAATIIPTLLVLDIVTSNGIVDQTVKYVMNDVFMANDPYRGIGTGFVGREVAWAQAWQLFEQHPLSGVGFVYFSETGTSSPHNAFLYGLAMHGIWSLPFWGIIFYMGVVLMRRARRDALLIFCFVPMLLLNDRFINMNTYPLLFYMFLFMLYQYEKTIRRSL